MGDMADYYRDQDLHDWPMGLGPDPHTGEQPRRSNNQMGDMADYARDAEERARMRLNESFGGSDEGREEPQRSPWDRDTFRRDENVEHDPLTGLWVHKSGIAVVGLPYPNPDGSSRMDAAKRVIDAQVLKLVREPGNAYDGNAIAVYEALWTKFPECEIRPSGQVGYLPRGIAELYAPLMDAGAAMFATVLEKVPKKGKDDGTLSHLRVRVGMLAASACPMGSGSVEHPDAPDLGGDRSSG